MCSLFLILISLWVVEAKDVYFAHSLEKSTSVFCTEDLTVQRISLLSFGFVCFLVILKKFLNISKQFGCGLLILIITMDYKDSFIYLIKNYRCSSYGEHVYFIFCYLLIFMYRFLYTGILGYLMRTGNKTKQVACYVS